MTIAASSVTGSGANTVVVDTSSVQHAVPAEGLAVTLATALTLPSGMVVGPTASGQMVVIFQQPPASEALPIEGGNAVQAGVPIALAIVEEG